MKNIAQKLKLVLHRVPTLLVMMFTLLATVYIYANSLEIVLSKDIDKVSAMQSVQGALLSSFSDFEISNVAPNLTGNVVGDYGELQAIKIPSIGRRISLIKGLEKEDGFLVKANNTHYLVKKDAKGSIKNILVYTIRSWRTINEPEEIVSGDNIYIDTNRGWRYVFRVEDVANTDNEGTYVYPEGKDLNLILLIQEENQSFVVRAKFLTVINISR